MLGQENCCTSIERAEKDKEAVVYVCSHSVRYKTIFLVYRQLNEELDSSANEKPEVAFGSETETFKKYHEAYKERKEHWAVDPLDLIITWIKENFPPPSVIADFGCGDARLASSVPNTVNSFDLFALNERVTACDMSHCPLKDATVDVAVFCLSLMGTNVGKYIVEANRVLKKR